MAFSNTTEWDVRSSGSDSNGGGFDLASTGTDYSQQDAAQVTYTDLAIDGTTNTKCTSAGHPFTSAHVGNIINITSGTGFTVQRVQVVSVVGSTATCDKSLGTLSSTGGNGVLGGGLLTLGTAFGLVVTSGQQKVWLKSGTYTITGVFSQPQSTPILGYTTSHYDGAPTRPLITTSTNSINFFSNGNNIYCQGINFSTTAGTPGHCLFAGTGIPLVYLAHCKFSGFNTTIFGEWVTNQTYNFMYLVDVEITGDTASTGAIRNSGGGTLVGCYIHDNAGHGVTNGTNNGAGSGDGAWTLIDCVIVDNGNHGFYDQFSSTVVPVHLWSNTFAKNAGAGAKRTAAFTAANRAASCYGNVFALNTGKGLDLAANSAWTVEFQNTIYSNTGGNTIPYTPTAPITLTSDPFTASGSKNYTLNNTAGGGALLRNLGIPNPVLGAMNNYAAAGALQPQVVAGGGLMVHQDMQGGCTG